MPFWACLGIAMLAARVMPLMKSTYDFIVVTVIAVVFLSYSIVLLAGELFG